MEPELVDAGPALARAGLVHRLRRGSGAAPHPTVVMLHGRSGNENVMWIFARTVPAHWLLLAPRGIARDQGGYAWHPRQPDEWPTLSQFQEAAEAIRRFLLALPGLYQADLNRLYLMGFSQGAAASYVTAMRWPGLIKGIAGLVGFVPASNSETIDAAPLRHLPIFMAVGKNDPLIPAERAAACAQTLQAAGAALTYRAYTTGHKLNAEGMRDLKQWWSALPG